MKKIEIRDAEKEMYQSIREQRIDAYREYIEVLPADHWNALKKAISSTVDEHEGVELIVAMFHEKIVGSVALFPAKTNAYEGYIGELDYPEIRMLAVASDARGQGVASALISECIKRSKAKGFNSIGLHTGEFMKNAIDLYERAGFERLPQFDFEPAHDGIIVRAYQLNFTDQA
ncbi:GNAT family N-acetyltransferase [Domibacillus sp. A3M-37]|uniref:GNAT family N-acetyltransferase n=1 Tax=Domibacillus sp. A3M-37 TaxID=2962037 RepID=UPI0020B6CB71|nr:GNAT family N-acetyltransferase [Domibacillus sp. A3M-37]MCP3764207.1 GNAT family N-acetyltransferase [Domibacillus sp. A3M-37]